MAGTALTTSPIQSSYAGLLKTTDNLTLDGTLRKVTDGLGVESALELSTDGAKVDGTLHVTGAVTFDTALTVDGGGTGLSTVPANGHLLIGNGTDYTSDTLTAGYGLTITNGAGSITPAVNLTVSNSDLGASNGVTQTGSLGGDVVFTAVGAPSVSLVAGTWYLTGSVTVRTSDTRDDIWAQFYNVDTSTAFGGGATSNMDVPNRTALNVSGAIVLSSAATIRFKVFRAGSSTLDVGAASGPAGWIQAVRVAT